MSWNFRSALVIACIVVAAIAAGFLIFGPADQKEVWGAAVALLVLALLAAIVLHFWPVSAGAEGALCDGYRTCVAWLLALGGGALVVFVLVWVMWKFTGGASGAAVALPMIVIVGVIVLLIVISLVTFIFSVLGLASPTEALGLPDGSVRSIIALMLLVLFSIVSIFLYDSVATGKVDSIPHLSGDQVAAMRGQVSVVVVVPDATTPPAPATFSVYYRNANPAAEDIAKQLIVLLGTLVTAVASFYFGSNAVASATAAAAAQQTQQNQPGNDQGSS